MEVLTHTELTILLIGAFGAGFGLGAIFGVTR